MPRRKREPEVIDVPEGWRSFFEGLDTGAPEVLQDLRAKVLPLYRRLRSKAPVVTTKLREGKTLRDRGETLRHTTWAIFWSASPGTKQGKTVIGANHPELVPVKDAVTAWMRRYNLLEHQAHVGQIAIEILYELASNAKHPHGALWWLTESSGLRLSDGLPVLVGPRHQQRIAFDSPVPADRTFQQYQKRVREAAVNKLDLVMLAAWRRLVYSADGANGTAAMTGSNLEPRDFEMLARHVALGENREALSERFGLDATTVYRRLKPVATALGIKLRDRGRPGKNLQ